MSQGLSQKSQKRSKVRRTQKVLLSERYVSVYNFLQFWVTFLFILAFFWEYSENLQEFYEIVLL